MNARLEPFELTRAAEETNDMREKVRVWQNVGTIRAAISTGGGSLQTQNELLRVESTHTAVTWDSVEIGDRFGGYEVTYVIPGGRRRMHQLFLKRVDAP